MLDMFGAWATQWLTENRNLTNNTWHSRYCFSHRSCTCLFCNIPSYLPWPNPLPHPPYKKGTCFFDHFWTPAFSIVFFSKKTHLFVPASPPSFRGNQVKRCRCKSRAVSQSHWWFISFEPPLVEYFGPHRLHVVFFCLGWEIDRVKSSSPSTDSMSPRRANCLANRENFQRRMQWSSIETRQSHTKVILRPTVKSCRVLSFSYLISRSKLKGFRDETHTSLKGDIIRHMALAVWIQSHFTNLKGANKTNMIVICIYMCEYSNSKILSYLYMCEFTWVTAMIYQIV